MRLFLLSLAGLALAGAPARAQLSAGASGWYVKAGTAWFADSLVMIPSADAALVSNTLSRNATPVVGTAGASIQRVYHFSAPFAYEGFAYFYFLNGELNGNNADNLQLAYLDQSNDPTTTSGGFSSSFSNFVGNTLTGVSMRALTAVNGGTPLPLSGAGLQATCYAQYILLRAQVLDNAGYERLELERCTDGGPWQPAGTTYTTGGVSAADYAFRDTDVRFGKRRYRLILIARDGTRSFSPECSVSPCGGGQAASLLVSTEAGGGILLSPANAPTLSEARVVDMNGRAVWQAGAPAYQYRVGGLAPGLYVAHARTGDQMLVTRFTVR